MAYKSALISNLSSEVLASAAIVSTPTETAQVHTFWEDCWCKDEELADYHNKWQKEQWIAFQRLRKSPTFQRKFDTFAENVLCIQDTDVEKGARLTLEPTQYWFEENIPKGKLRA